MWSVASTTGALATVSADVSTILVYWVPIVLGALVALIGLGWGVGKFRRYIAGKKF